MVSGNRMYGNTQFSKFGGLTLAMAATAWLCPMTARAQDASKAAEKPASSKTAVDKAGSDEKAAKPQKPAKQVTRKDYIDLPGAPRTPIAGFRGRSKAMPYDKPTDDQVDSVRRGTLDRPAVDAVAKAGVYALTNPNDELNIGKNVEEIVKVVRGTKPEVARVYKEAVIKYAKNLLDNSFVVQVNATLLIGRMMDGSNDSKDGVPIFVEILKDGTREDAVLYLALRGLEIAKQHKLLDVAPEREAVGAILNLSKRNGIQPLLFEELVTALGAFGMAYSGDLPERAEVAVFLANLSLDSKQPLRLRFEATHGLGSVNPTPLSRVNWELAGFVLAKFVNELVSAHKDNKVPEETFRYWLFSIGLDFKNLNKASGNERFRELTEAVQSFAAAVIDKQPADAAPIAAWLANGPPKDLRLAPSAEPLKMPATAK